jgi:ribosomal RNA-processing protein 9
MLGNKRKKTGNSNKRDDKKSKKGMKVKTFESRQFKKKDEEILSEESEEENAEEGLKNDKFFEEEEQNFNEATNDEKRLKMAKKLIQKIGEKTKAEDDDGDGDEREEINEYITKEITKEKKEHHIELIKDSLSLHEEKFVKGHKGSITSLVLTNDSKFSITTSKDTRAILWDLSASKRILLPKFSNKPLNSCKLLQDDTLALFGGNDKFLYMMDMKSHEIVSKVKAHNNYINGIAIDSESEHIYSISNDMTVKIWAGYSNKHIIPLETFWGHTNKIYDIDYLSKNRLISCGFDKNVMLWKIDSQSYLQYKYNEDCSIDHVKVLNNNNFVTGDYNGNLFLWKADKKKPICKLHNTHKFSKEFNFSRKYEESFNFNFYRNNQNLLDNVIENKIDYSNETQCQIANPIMSIDCVRNTDLLVSGSNNGILNVYKYSKKESSIEIKLQHEIRGGCVNDIKISNDHSFMVLGIGKDCKFGRWDCSKRAKNGISLVKIVSE